NCRQDNDKQNMDDNRCHSADGTHDETAPAHGTYKRVCYYTNWSQYRSPPGRFTPDDIDPRLCTHIIFAFAKVVNSEMHTIEWNDIQMFEKLNALKNRNPGLKTLIAVGGWNAASNEFTKMVSSVAFRRKFVLSALAFISRYGFDGLDLDWEYPGQRGGKLSDKRNLVKLLQHLHRAFTPKHYLLTAAVPAGKKNVDVGYDVPQLAKYLDFINVMTYDLHGGWERQTGLNSPLYPRTGETGAERELNMQWAANYWVAKGAPRHKLVIGLALYGRSFALTSPARTDVGAPATGPGPKGRYTGEAGFLAYYEICAMQESGKGRTIWQAEQHTPYYVNGNLWVGFDNKRSITEKVKWLMDNKFGGAMVWSLDLDDFRRTCRTSIERYPLLSTVNRLLASGQQPTTPDRRIETTTSRQKNHTVVTTTSSSTTTIHSKTEFTCTGKTDGYYADPSSCKRFYRCIFQRKYEFSCPESCHSAGGQHGLKASQGLTETVETVVRVIYQLFTVNVSLTGKNVSYTQSAGERPFEVGLSQVGGQRVRVYMRVLDKKDGMYLITFRIYETLRDLQITITKDDKQLGDSPFSLTGAA
ncbi:CHIA-like protein, partial [Mya arenaria]